MFCFVFDVGLRKQKRGQNSTRTCSPGSPAAWPPASSLFRGGWTGVSPGRLREAGAHTPLPPKHRVLENKDCHLRGGGGTAVSPRNLGAHPEPSRRFETDSGPGPSPGPRLPRPWSPVHSELLAHVPSLFRRHFRSGLTGHTLAPSDVAQRGAVSVSCSVTGCLGSAGLGRGPGSVV